ncbi:hypothetical protein EYC55_09895 [Xanthomonas oryzae]|nr:hypothetical protein EYC54_13440 [Xanthomonas oryzae]QBG91858.1 hypothetical protein EYR26_09945 [Xanthomonas oryzae]QBG95722.1 hypothetical protein EYC55_09895 [Xanthomonas oryzae]QBG99666.1 hypothetical protein EYC56_10355 [Xanthomonas oryzae]
MCAATKASSAGAFAGSWPAVASNSIDSSASRSGASTSSKAHCRRGGLAHAAQCLVDFGAHAGVFGLAQGGHEGVEQRCIRFARGGAQHGRRHTEPHPVVRQPGQRVLANEVVRPLLAFEIVQWPVRAAGHPFHFDRQGALFGFHNDVDRLAVAQRQ